MDRHRQASGLRRWRRRLAAACTLATLGLVALLPAAGAHLAEFTGEDTYGCTTIAETWCYYQGGEFGTTNSGSAVSHSYGFQSAEWGAAGSATVYTAICYSSCAVASGTNFRRLCWPNWQHSAEPLDCHDQDGVSGTARVKAGTAGTVRGHALW